LTETPRRSRRLAILLLAILTASAALLRCVELSNGLPQASDPDAAIVNAAIELDRDPGDPRARRMPSIYPLLLARALDALPGRLVVQAPEGATLDEHLAAASNPELVARWLIALISLLAIPATYLLARRFLTPMWSLYAVGLIAFSLLHLTHSRVAKPHGPLTSLLVITVVSAMWVARRGTLGSFVAMALGAALTVGCLHSGAAVLPAVFVASLFAWRRAGRAKLAKLALAPVAVLASIWAFYPFLLEGNLWAGRKFRADTFDWSGLPKLVKGLLGADPMLALLLVLGLAFVTPRVFRKWGSLASDRAADLCVVLAFVVPYTLAISAYYWSWPRFVLPLLPCFAVLAAFGTKRSGEVLGNLLPAGVLRRAAPVVVALAAVALPAYAATRWAWLHTLPNSAELAADWVRENARPRRDVVALSPLLYLPLLSDPRGLREIPRYAHAPLQRYQSQVRGMDFGDDVFRLRSLIIQRKLGEPQRYERALMARMIRERSARLAVVWLPAGDPEADPYFIREALADLGGELVFSTVPYRASHFEWGFDDDVWMLSFEALLVALRSERIGPAIEIHRLP